MVVAFNGGGSVMEERRSSFDEDIRFFLNACPGPAMARRGLHIAAFQEVRGISGLKRSGEDEERRRGFESRRGSGQIEGDGSYLRKQTEIAELLRCRPAYLTEAALRHGYQYSRALRWIRFFHGVALRAAGVNALSLATRLAFSDVAGWSRFTKKLVGRTPSQLPNLPLEYWVRWAVDDVFLSPASTGTETRAIGRREDNRNR